jgi:hypothetical protein
MLYCFIVTAYFNYCFGEVPLAGEYSYNGLILKMECNRSVRFLKCTEKCAWMHNFLCTSDLTTEDCSQ